MQSWDVTLVQSARPIYRDTECLAKGQSWGLSLGRWWRTGDRRSDHARGLETEQSGVVSWESEGNQQAQVTSGRIWWKK